MKRSKIEGLAVPPHILFVLLFLKLHKPFKNRNSSGRSHETPQGYPDTSSQHSSPTLFQFCCTYSSLLQSKSTASERLRPSLQHTRPPFHFSCTTRFNHDLQPRPPFGFVSLWFLRPWLGSLPTGTSDLPAAAVIPLSSAP